MHALILLVVVASFSPVATIPPLHGMVSFFPYREQPVIDMDAPIPITIPSATVSRSAVEAALLERSDTHVIPSLDWIGPDSTVRRAFAGPDAMSRRSLAGQGSIPRYLLEGLGPILRPAMGSEPRAVGIGSPISRGSRSSLRGPRQIIHHLRKVGVIGEGTPNRGYYIPNRGGQSSSSYDPGYDVFIVQREPPSRGPRGDRRSFRQLDIFPLEGGPRLPLGRFSTPPDAGMSPRTGRPFMERLPPVANSVEQMLPSSLVTTGSTNPATGPLSPRTESPPMERLALLPRITAQSPSSIRASPQSEHFSTGSSSPRQGNPNWPGGPDQGSTYGPTGGIQPRSSYQTAINPGQTNSYISPDRPRQRSSYGPEIGLNRGGAYSPAGGPDPGSSYQSGPGPELGPGPAQGPYQPSSGPQPSGTSPAEGSRQGLIFRNTNRVGSYQLLQGQNGFVRSFPYNQLAVYPYPPIVPYSPNAPPPGVVVGRNVGPPYDPMAGLSPPHGGPKSVPPLSSSHGPLPPSGGPNAGRSPHQSSLAPSLVPLPPSGGPNAQTSPYNPRSGPSHIPSTPPRGSGPRHGSSSRPAGGHNSGPPPSDSSAGSSHYLSPRAGGPSAGDRFTKPSSVATGAPKAGPPYVDPRHGPPPPPADQKAGPSRDRILPSLTPTIPTARQVNQLWK